MKSVLAGVVRWVFGLFYTVMGAVSLTFRLLDKPFVTPANNAQEYAFASALTASGFIDPLISATCLVGGLLVLVRRTTPLGLVVLAPLVTVIFLYHLLLSGSPAIGAVQLVLLLALAWVHRGAYRPLWSHGTGAPPNNSVRDSPSTASV